MMSATATSYQDRGGGGNGTSNDDDGDTTPLMQRNYLHAAGTGGGSDHPRRQHGGNAQDGQSAPRRRGAASGMGAQHGGQAGPQTPDSFGQTAQSSWSATSFSPPPQSPDGGGSDKDHGHKFSSSRISGCLASAGRSCLTCGAERRDDGLHYMDDFNDQSWSCSAGTSESDGIWTNTVDQAGTILAGSVWFLLGYSAVTVTMLAETGGIPPALSDVYCVLCVLALASHAKTSLTDPGAIPQAAVPRESLRNMGNGHSMCSQCQTFKPPFSHHCRICNRCVARMDHHCPWMNNCIGIGNMKHFLLFLLYTWTCSAFSLALLGWNYFLCADEDCTFAPVLVQLVRVMTVLSTGAFLFTSSMLMNVCYGLMTGIGTIDRLKKKAANTMNQSDEEPIPLRDVFGIAGYWTWPFPVDPVFEDYDRVMGYSTPQRLLREQLRENPNAAPGDYSRVPTHAAKLDGGGGVSKEFLSV